MKIYHGRLSKEKLSEIPKNERCLFISIAHSQNEIRFALRSVLFSSDYSLSDDVEIHGQISLAFFYLRILAGKLSEGWQLLQKYFFSNKEISIGFNDNGTEEGVESLKDLKKYFGKNNSVTEIRNNLSFHYSPNDLDAQLDGLPDDLDLYIEKGTDANTLYYFAEVLANRAAMSKIKIADDVNPFDGVYRELTEIATIFNKFNMHFMSYFIKKYSPDIWDGNVSEVEFENLTQFSDIRIPMFADTTDGLTKKVL